MRIFWVCGKLVGSCIKDEVSEQRRDSYGYELYCCAEQAKQSILKWLHSVLDDVKMVIVGVYTVESLASNQIPELIIVSCSASSS